MYEIMSMVRLFCAKFFTLDSIFDLIIKLIIINKISLLVHEIFPLVVINISLIKMMFFVYFISLFFVKSLFLFIYVYNDLKSASVFIVFFFEFFLWYLTKIFFLRPFSGLFEYGFNRDRALLCLLFSKIIYSFIILYNPAINLFIVSVIHLDHFTELKGIYADLNPDYPLSKISDELNLQKYGEWFIRLFIDIWLFIFIPKNMYNLINVFMSQCDGEYNYKTEDKVLFDLFILLYYFAWSYFWFLNWYNIWYIIYIILIKNSFIYFYFYDFYIILEWWYFFINY